MFQEEPQYVRQVELCNTRKCQSRPLEQGLDLKRRCGTNLKPCLG